MSASRAFAKVGAAPAKPAVVPPSAEDEGVDADSEILDGDELALGGRDTTQDGTTDQTPAQDKALIPSSFGMTFSLNLETKEIQLSAAWGQYVKELSEYEKTEAGNPRRVWKRHPRGDKHRLTLKDGPIPPISFDQNCPDVVIQGLTRKRSDHWCVTLFLVNEQQEPEKLKDAAWVFQPELMAEGVDGAAVIHKRQLTFESTFADAKAKDEHDQLAMLFRRHVEFAVGHGIGVHVDVSPDPNHAILRENIFERVRQKDKEFTRLETSVVSLDWTPELLTEVVERRLIHHLNTKPKVGETWDLFFEPQCEGISSKDYIFNFCQHRPRDVLTYCSMAIDSAQRFRRSKIAPDDLKDARRRFSQSRFKDLGDEYSENYPQIQVVLSKFHGLYKEMSTVALAVIHRKLLADDDVKTYCHEWVYNYGDVYQFIELLYGIGFWGVRSKGALSFRGVGTTGSSLPPIDLTNSSVVVHPTYADALDLRDDVINILPESINLQVGGGLLELPDSATLAEYHRRLYNLLDEIKNLPTGQTHDDKYEDFVFNVISLCLRPYLGNVQKRSRTVDNRVIRDIIATNVASGGFWSMARQQYHATQVIWECKNYETLKSSDFHQATYYLNKSIGFFLILCHRGTDSDKSHYYEHIRRAAAIHTSSPAIIIPINDKDLKVFIRQAINHKTKDDHIYNIHDEIIRKIS